MGNSLDGKRIGWYDNDEKAAENMEKYWSQFQHNERLAVRFIQSDEMKFKYEVNYKDMIQTNTKTGTRRVLRRVPAGETVSSAAPETIPDPVKPTAHAFESVDDDNDDDDDEDSDDGEDGEDHKEE